MKTRRSWLVALVPGGLLVTLPSAVLAQKKKKKKGKPTKSVTGLVTNESEEGLEGAVVQLKNTRTLQVKTFIVDERGSYYFRGLDPSIDYEIKARYEESTSRTRTVSSFDSRDKVIYNFKIKVEK
jgi:hypothetical protein